MLKIFLKIAMNFHNDFLLEIYNGFRISKTVFKSFFYPWNCLKAVGINSILGILVSFEIEVHVKFFLSVCQYKCDRNILRGLLVSDPMTSFDFCLHILAKIKDP